MTDQRYRALAVRIVEQWEALRRVFDRVPPEAEIRGWLERLGGATEPRMLGITDAEYQQGLKVGHYYRARFTGKKLAHYMGI
jgi:hypothetical protein